jgi:hypothetical protein
VKTAFKTGSRDLIARKTEQTRGFWAKPGDLNVIKA